MSWSFCKLQQELIRHGALSKVTFSVVEHLCKYMSIQLIYDDGASDTGATDDNDADAYAYAHADADTNDINADADADPKVSDTKELHTLECIHVPWLSIFGQVVSL